MSVRPWRGADGRYHFIYVTRHVHTNEWYRGRHSTARLNDGYLGSGNWVRAMKQIAPGSLAVEPVRFFQDADWLKRAESRWLARDKAAADPLCRNWLKRDYALAASTVKTIWASTRNQTTWARSAPFHGP